MFRVRCLFTRRKTELRCQFFKEEHAIESALYCRTLALRRGGGLITVHNPGDKLLLILGV